LHSRESVQRRRRKADADEDHVAIDRIGNQVSGFREEYEEGGANAGQQRCAPVGLYGHRQEHRSRTKEVCCVANRKRVRAIGCEQCNQGAPVDAQCRECPRIAKDCAAEGSARYVMIEIAQHRSIRLFLQLIEQDVNIGEKG
jgi:hypothetical protein